MQSESYKKPVFSRHFQFSALEFIFWFAMATVGYLTVFLESLGFSPTQIGRVAAINSAVGIIAAPFWGMVADKIRSVKKVFLLCIITGSLLWALVPFTSRISVGPIMLCLILVPISMFFRNPANSLMDNWVVQTANRENLNYGGMRLWGSLSYAIMAISLSFILPKLGVEWTFYMLFVLILPLFAIATAIKGDSTLQKKPIPLKEMHLEKLFRNYYYITYLIFAIALHMPTQTSNTFLPYLIKNVNGNTAQIGMIMGYKALLEIPMLVLLKSLRKRFPLYYLLLGAAFFYTLEAFLYSGATSFYQIVLISTFHGLGGGLYIGTAANYVYTLAPGNLKATAQTVNGSMTAIAGIIGNLFGGMLLDAYGVVAFYRLIGFLIIGAICIYVISILIAKYILHLPPPGQHVEHSDSF